MKTEKTSATRILSAGGIPLFVDDIHGLAHNKVMVIDGRVVITGSFSLTRAAEEANPENLLVIRDEALPRNTRRTGRSVGRTPFRMNNQQENRRRWHAEQRRLATVATSAFV